MEDDLHGWMMGCNNELGGREVETLDLKIAHELRRMKRMKHEHLQTNTCSHESDLCNYHISRDRHQTRYLFLLNRLL
jgi:hypothetical protein